MANVGCAAGPVAVNYLNYLAAARDSLAGPRDHDQHPAAWPLAATQSSTSFDDLYGAMALERLARRQDQQVEEWDGA